MELYICWIVNNAKPCVFLCWHKAHSVAAACLSAQPFHIGKRIGVGCIYIHTHSVAVPAQDFACWHWLYVDIAIHNAKLILY